MVIAGDEPERIRRGVVDLLVEQRAIPGRAGGGGHGRMVSEAVGGTPRPGHISRGPGRQARAEVYETVVRAVAPDEISSSPRIPAVQGTVDFIEPFLVFQDLLFGEDSQMAGKTPLDRPARCRRPPRRLDDP